MTSLNEEGNPRVFHANDGNTGKHALQISTIERVNGWPEVALGTAHEPPPP
ncbi:MAG: hypothetical protein JO033_08145 [Acidobacteriaceae bacterium]|nr:hypothetical protein [Acidobacteriaceae bacterium]MBV9499163.1 hypothetical protein [Acidobacteriaceae bacterium]